MSFRFASASPNAAAYDADVNATRAPHAAATLKSAARSSAKRGAAADGSGGRAGTATTEHAWHARNATRKSSPGGNASTTAAWRTEGSRRRRARSSVHGDARTPFSRSSSSRPSRARATRCASARASRRARSRLVESSRKAYANARDDEAEEGGAGPATHAGPPGACRAEDRRATARPRKRRLRERAWRRRPGAGLAARARVKLDASWCLERFAASLFSIHRGSIPSVPIACRAVIG